MNIETSLQMTASLFDWVWTTTLQAGVLIVIVLLVRLLLGRWLPARILYLLGLLIIARLVMPVAPSSFLSIHNLWKNSPGPVAVAPAEQLPTIDVLPNADLAEMVVGEVTFTAIVAPDRPTVRWVPIIWIAVVVFLLAYRLVQQALLGRRVRRSAINVSPVMNALLEECRSRTGVRRRVRIVELDGWKTPAVFQFLRPVLILPKSFENSATREELKMVFLHELAHIKRGDVLWNWTVIFVKALHWFNPLVWVAMDRFIADRELLCDERVLQQLHENEHPQYGNALLKLSEGISRPGLCPSLVPIINHQKQIKRRIIMISKFKPVYVPLLVADFLLVGLLSLSTFTSATGQLTQQLVGEAGDLTSGGMSLDNLKSYLSKQYTSYDIIWKKEYSMEPDEFDRINSEAEKFNAASTNIQIRISQESSTHYHIKKNPNGYLYHRSPEPAGITTLELSSISSYVQGILPGTQEVYTLSGGENGKSQFMRDAARYAMFAEDKPWQDAVFATANGPLAFDIPLDKETIEWNGTSFTAKSLSDHALSPHPNNALIRGDCVIEGEIVRMVRFAIEGVSKHYEIYFGSDAIQIDEAIKIPSEFLVYSYVGERKILETRYTILEFEDDDLPDEELSLHPFHSKIDYSKSKEIYKSSGGSMSMW